MSSIIDIRRRMETPPSFEGSAEAVIKKCSKAMDAIWEDHCNLMAATDAKLIILNMSFPVPDPSRDDAEGDQTLADLRKALDSKESEIQSLKSKLKDQFHDYQWKMSEKVVEVVDLKRDGRALNMRLINTQRKAASAKRRMCREIERRVALTRANNLLQQTNGSLVVKSRTSTLECDKFKEMYNELRDWYESSLSECSSLKRRIDDSQAEYDGLRSAHDSLRKEHHNSQLRFRELEEAHENSKLEYQKREEELRGSIAELTEALNLTNAAGVDDDRVKARLEVPLRRQSKELKKTKVNFRKQISQLKSSLKRKAEGFCELQMVIEEAERAVSTRDQRISGLEAALRKTAEELSQARAEVEAAKGLTGQQLESEGEQMELFNEEGDNIETDGEGNSSMLGVPIVDYFNDAMVDAPSRPFTPQPSDTAIAAAPSAFAVANPLFGLSAPSACASQASHNLYTSSAFLPLVAPSTSLAAPPNLVAPSPLLAAPTNLVPTSSLTAPTTSQLSSPLSSPPSSPPPPPPSSAPRTPPNLPAASSPMVPDTPVARVPSTFGTVRRPMARPRPRRALNNWGSSEASSSRTEEHRAAASPPVPETTTAQMAITPADSMALSPAEAKEMVEELLQAFDTKLLGIKTLSKFYTSNRQMFQQHLNLDTITNAGQLGDHLKELLTKSHGLICEGLEKPLTDADLRPSDFNYDKWFRINVNEDRLTRLINQLYADFRSSVKLENSPLMLSMSRGKEAFLKALDAQRARTDGVSLPSSPI